MFYPLYSFIDPDQFLCLLNWSRFLSNDKILTLFPFLLCHVSYVCKRIGDTTTQIFPITHVFTSCPVTFVQPAHVIVLSLHILPASWSPTLYTSYLNNFFQASTSSNMFITHEHLPFFSMFRSCVSPPCCNIHSFLDSPCKIIITSS